MIKKIIFLLGAAVFLIIGEQLSLPSHEYAGWVLLGIFLLIRFWPHKRENEIVRIILILFGALITTRYLFFRTFFTLSAADWVVFCFAFALYAAELFAGLLHFLGLFVNLAPLKYDSEPLPDDLPGVDVFITTYQELPHIALMSAQAALQMKYPKTKLNVYILDEGCRLDTLNDPVNGTDALIRYDIFQEKAKKYGFKHIFRAVPHKAKAGLVNDAFFGKCYSKIEKNDEGVFVGQNPVKTNGDFILILDCDHIPATEFLDKTIGFFKDPEVFLVQTPHFMINPDAIQRNLDLKKRLPPESWLFYFAIQNGLNRWNASFFCGSAGVLRRKALQANGGLSGSTITEDAETSIDMHARKGKSIYFARPMVAGLEAENIDGLIKQRRRWCQGMLQVLILKNPLFKRGLTLPQRVCYLCSCLFWLFPIARCIFLLAPFAFLFFNVNIYNASFMQVINFAFPHLLVSIFLADYLFGKYRPFLASEVFESIQSFQLLPSIARLFLSPLGLKFVPTPKSVLMKENEYSRYYVLMFVLFLLMVFACFRAVDIWTADPLLRPAVELTAFWNVFNMLIVMICLGALWERPQRRRQHRYLPFDSRVFLNGEAAVMENLSLSGALIRTDKKVEIGQKMDFKSGDFVTKFQIIRTEPNKIGGIFVGDEFSDRVVFTYGSDRVWNKTVEDRMLPGKTGFSNSLYLIKTGLVGFWKSLFGMFRGAKRMFLISCLMLCLWPNRLSAETLELPLSTFSYGPSEIIETKVGSVKMPIHLPLRWDIKRISIDLFYENSNGIVPPESKIDVFWNANHIETIPLFPEVPKANKTFSIPQNMTGTEDNEIKIGVLQTSATNNCRNTQVWTKIDFEHSKMTIEYDLKPLTAQTSADFEFLYDPKAPVVYPLNFVIPNKSADNIKAAAIAASKIALFAGSRPLDISVSDQPVLGRDNYGVGVKIDPVSPQYTALPIEQIPEPRKIYGSILIQPDKAYTFEQMGQGNILFRTSRHNGRLKFRIPSITYLSPNRKMRLNFNLAYGDEISPATKLSVLINGKPLANLYLNKAKGDVLKSYEIEVPMSLLHKDENRLSFETDLEPVNPETCLDVRNQNLFLMIFSSSSVSFPLSGKHYEMPDIGLFFNDGFPFDGSGGFYIQDPSLVAPLLSVVSMVSQRRGTLPQNLLVAFNPDEIKNRNMAFFTLSPLKPQQDLKVSETLMPQGNIVLQVQAASIDGLEKAILKMWEVKTVKGNEMILTSSGQIISEQTQPLLIFSNLGWFSFFNDLTANNPVSFLFFTVIFIIGGAFAIFRGLPKGKGEK